MKRTLTILTVVLVAQLGLFGLLILPHGAAQNAEQGQDLFSFTPDQVSKIQIFAKDDKPLTLTRIGSHWLLPEHGAAAADSGKVSALLQQLVALQRPWPVAHSAEVAKRFQVAADDYQRKLVLYHGDKALATLLVGSSPGFRKVHARLDGEEQIYDILFSSYQASVKNDDWLDKGVVALSRDQIRAIDLNDFRLLNKEGKAVLDELTPTEETAPDKAAALLQEVSSMQISDIEPKQGKELPRPADLTLAVELAGGQSRTYQFAKAAAGDYALLQVSGFDQLFRVDAGLLDRLQHYQRQQLIKTAAQQQDNQDPQAASSARDTSHS